jgi:hypothetical protein
MNTLSLSKIIMLSSSMLLSQYDCFAQSNGRIQRTPSAQTRPERDNTKIQVAILLDTSSSMDGLIEQAKSRIWNIINTLTTLKYHGKTPSIEIALYEYGNSGLDATSQWIRRVTPLTNDLDLISQELFALTTNGGEEYCGAVIKNATQQLEWGKNEQDMKLIFICGNEPFNQGKVNFKESISTALQNNIYINTIHCGTKNEGIRGLWEEGARVGKGKFFNIDSDRKVRFVATPYDDDIDRYNRKLNDTYIGYGSAGSRKKKVQMEQDEQAASISVANKAERTISKSSAVYDNQSWDLVDKFKADSTAINAITDKDMPTEYQGKSKKEIETIVRQKTKERSSIQQSISELSKKRQAYIDAEMKKDKNEDDLGIVINQSIISLAKQKGYTL